jgi:hypothetical protein
MDKIISQEIGFFGVVLLILAVVIIKPRLLEKLHLFLANIPSPVWIVFISCLIYFRLEICTGSDFMVCINRYIFHKIYAPRIISSVMLAAMVWVFLRAFVFCYYVAKDLPKTLLGLVQCAKPDIGEKRDRVNLCVIFVSLFVIDLAKNGWNFDINLPATMKWATHFSLKREVGLFVKWWMSLTPPLAKGYVMALVPFAPFGAIPPLLYGLSQLNWRKKKTTAGEVVMLEHQEILALPAPEVKKADIKKVS